MVAKMADNPQFGYIRDEHDIAALLFRWGHARDCDDWETLAACFHDDATIHISWISAPALPASRKPLETTIAAGIPAAPHAATASTAVLAGIAMIARSTSSGISSRLL